MVPRQRPVMPADIFNAAIKGDNDVLIRRLGLLEERKEVKVTIEASPSAPRLPEARHNKNVESELGSATRFGDTLLHLLITEKHNELALKVFAKDISLLKACNNKQETPLHCAARFGNVEVIRNLIRLYSGVVKDALGETNENRDTALHIAANHDQKDVVLELMKLEPEEVHKENKQGFSPLYISIVEGYTSMVIAMLEVDAALACTQFFDGTFPVHVAARTGNTNLVVHFLKEYPDYAKLLDPCRRNLFHVAAEHKVEKVFTEVAAEQKVEKVFAAVFELTKNGSPHIALAPLVDSMINARDYEGNTPLHIGAKKGHREVMRAIWDKLNHDRRALLANQKGETAFNISLEQQWNTKERTEQEEIDEYVEDEGWCFTLEWFDEVMQPPIPNKLERSQLVGLGAVLITTVAFAAALTVPGGYNADNGTPVLGRKFMFKAFILANTLAFMLSFQSMFTLVFSAQDDPTNSEFHFAMTKFRSAATCMVVAFGLGSYVVLAPVSLPIAIILLVVTLLLWSHTAGPSLFVEQKLLERFERFDCSNWFSICGTPIMLLLLIFCLASL